MRRVELFERKENHECGVVEQFKRENIPQLRCVELFAEIDDEGNAPYESDVAFRCLPLL